MGAELVSQGEFPGCSGLVALTLDDAPCRGETSMLCEIKVGDLRRWE